jgi:hypothetical protein
MQDVTNPVSAPVVNCFTAPTANSVRFLSLNFELFIRNGVKCG